MAQPLREPFGIRQDLSVDELKVLQHQLAAARDSLITKLEELDVREELLRRRAIISATAATTHPLTSSSAR
jgi:hypothetical protein